MGLQIRPGSRVRLDKSNAASAKGEYLVISVDDDADLCVWARAILPEPDKLGRKLSSRIHVFFLRELRRA